MSSPLVMDPRLGVKERSKLTGWVSSTVICVRGRGQECFFWYKTIAIVSNKHVWQSTYD